MMKSNTPSTGSGDALAYDFWYLKHVAPGIKGQVFEVTCDCVEPFSDYYLGQTWRVRNPLKAKSLLMDHISKGHHPDMSHVGV